MNFQNRDATTLAQTSQGKRELRAQCEVWGPGRRKEGDTTRARLGRQEVAMRGWAEFLWTRRDPTWEGGRLGATGPWKRPSAAPRGWGGGLSSRTRHLECWAGGDVPQPTMQLSAGPTAQECGKMCAF